MWIPDYRRQPDGTWVMGPLNPLHPLLPPLPAMAPDGPAKSADDVQADIISDFLAAEDRLLDLRVWRYLRIRYPHLSSNVHEIDREIASERRRRNAT